jgi:hypothetical protein
MSAGIAETGMYWQKSAKPVPLPVQALDHATGYFMAATAIRAVTRRLDEGFGMEAHLSLARTAKLLTDGGDGDPSSLLLPETIGGSASHRRTHGLGRRSAPRASDRSRRRGDAVGTPRPKAGLRSTGMALKTLPGNRARAAR